MRKELEKRIYKRVQAYAEKGLTVVPAKWILTTEDEFKEWYADTLPKTSPLRKILLKELGVTEADH